MLWPDADLSQLTAGAARAAGASVVDTALPRGSRARLVHLCEALRCPLEPSADALAGHVERIVAALPLPGPDEPVDRWDGVYADLPHLFPDGTGRALRGRRLLLAADGTLQRTNGTAADDPAAPGTRRPARRQAF
ncbi:hypothetical protein GTY54_13685, partial [Streptomyces sp. SID625]|nr:hypothetical protein [Streptomyces sp. SID625]